jgi:hypothetical protein
MTSRPSRLMASRPSRLMTSRPSRHHDLTALAPHGSTALVPHDHSALAPRDFAALAPPPRTRSPDPRLQRGPPPRYANCGRAIEGHQSRRHTGYVTALGRDCRGCLRIDATRSSQHLTVCAIPGSGQHLRVCAATSPSRHPTRRASAGGEGSTPNHPAALRSGMKMGFNSPGQHHTAHSPDKRERTQVLFLFHRWKEVAPIKLAIP